MLLIAIIDLVEGPPAESASAAPVPMDTDVVAASAPDTAGAQEA